MLSQRKYKPGDWVVFRKVKHTPTPGKRAENVIPAKGGDSYSYTVDKCWVVQEVRNDGHLLLRTRRGKLHTIAADDLSLRPANLWDRLRYRGRFKAIELEGPGKIDPNNPPAIAPKQRN